MSRINSIRDRTTWDIAERIETWQENSWYCRTTRDIEEQTRDVTTKLEILQTPRHRYVAERLETSGLKTGGQKMSLLFGKEKKTVSFKNNLGRSTNTYKVTEPLETLQNHSKRCRTTRNVTEPLGTLQNHSWCYRTTRKFTDPLEMLQNHSRRYRTTRKVTEPLKML